MRKLNIFCTSIFYYKVLDNLPKYIIKLGLGDSSFPKEWLTEKKNDNISHLNKFYGEMTGIYWIWKNLYQNFNENDLIVNCHYRKFWLNDLYNEKQKNSKQSLFDNLLKENNPNLNKFENFQVQPIIFKEKNLLEDFLVVHKNDSLEKSIDFLDTKFRAEFKNHLEQKVFYPLNMFITTTNNFRKYCEIIFPWLESCYKYCSKKELCNGYNTRLPAFLAERFTSFWFSQETSANLSYARIGNIFLSNTINRVLNTINLHYTFKMYPTLHRY